MVDTLEEARKIYPDFGQYFAAMCVYEDDYSKLRLIFKSGSASLDMTAHECVHLADKICLLLGIEADADNDEPLAYMVQHIFGAAIKVQDLHGSKLLEDD